MIILQKETTEHREPGTSAPQGEPGSPPSVLTPQSPCTATRAVGVGTLERDTIYASAATTNESCRSSHRMMYSPVHTVGGSSLPSGWERILGQGHFHPPTCAGATIGAQNIDKLKTRYLTRYVQAIQARASPRGIQRRPVPSHARHGYQMVLRNTQATWHLRPHKDSRT